MPKQHARELGWTSDGTAFLCLGALTERKNVLRLARAFEHRGEGTLVFVGDGPLRGALEGRSGIRVVGRVGHDAVPAWIAASRRRLPAEPRRAVRPRDARSDGLRALGRGDDDRRAARVRHAGVRRPRRPAGRRRPRRSALGRPPRFPVQTSPAATQQAITTSSGRRSGWRRSSCEPLRDRRA